MDSKYFIEKLDSYDKRADALDFIYNCLDELLLNHEFIQVNEIIQEMILPANILNIKYQISYFLSILTASRPWKSHLPAREQLLHKIKLRIELENGEVDKCITGLT